MRLFVLVLLVACQPKPLPPPTPLPDKIISCSEASFTRTEDVCLGYFTPEGYACFYCNTVHGCIDTDVQIYCVKDNCSTDPHCRNEDIYPR